VVHSSVPLTGTYQGTPLAPPPSDIQGFGRVQLNQVLFGPASGANGNKQPGDRMLIVDDASEAIAAGQERTFQIPVGATPDAELGATVKITLVWTDAPAQPLANNPLVNNLDLSVTTSNGQTIWGNNVANGDTANTIEQIIVDTANGLTLGQPLTITVRGTTVPQGPQKFALVVTGPLDVTSPPPAARSPPPPRPPRAPGSGSDGAAFGVTIPLLALAIGAGGFFMCGKKPAGGSSTKGGAAATAAGGAALPAGWKQLRDPNSGATYYLNEATGDTQWTAPVAPSGAGPPTPREGGGLPAGWEKMTDASTGAAYYYNKNTGASQWLPPS